MTLDSGIIRRPSIHLQSIRKIKTPPKIVIHSGDEKEWIKDQSEYIISSTPSQPSPSVYSPLPSLVIFPPESVSNVDVYSNPTFPGSLSNLSMTKSSDTPNFMNIHEPISNVDPKMHQINSAQLFGDTDDDLLTPQLSSATNSSTAHSLDSSYSLKSIPPQFIFKRPSESNKSGFFKDLKRIFKSPSRSNSHKRYSTCKNIQIAKYGTWGKLLGSGVGGTVRLIHRSSDNKAFAMKQFQKRLPQESEKAYFKKIVAEFCIGSTLRHENIIQALDIIQEGTQFYEIMEFAPYDLFEVVLSKKMSFKEISCCIKQLINGVNYLHDMGIAHRDIKLDNCMLNELGIVKLIDFGCATIFRYPFDNKIMCFQGPRGSDPYICPESYNHAPHDVRLADIWSIGITFVCMHLGSFPWLIAKASEEFTYKSYLRNPDKLLRRLPMESRSLIGKILEVDVNKRATMKVIYDDDWFNGIEVCRGNGGSDGHAHHFMEGSANL